jgi:prepilin-type N-terminal cleavage/methylation domain-containing protein
MSGSIWADVAMGAPEGRRPGRGRPLGFTLLELLVVLAVITLLAALLFPTLAAARQRAHQATCLSNLRQIARAQLLYMDDWDERFPRWYFPAPPRPEPYGNYVYWTEYFQPYLRGAGVLRDPEARWIWDLPEAEKLGEYTLCTWGRGGRGTMAAPYWNWPGPSQTLTEVLRPAETITLMCGVTTGGWTSADLTRHRRGMNAAFVEGHARWLTVGEFWRVDTDGSGLYWLRYAAADR